MPTVGTHLRHLPALPCGVASTLATVRVAKTSDLALARQQPCGSGVYGLVQRRRLLLQPPVNPFCTIGKTQGFDVHDSMILSCSRCARHPPGPVWTGDIVNRCSETWCTLQMEKMEAVGDRGGSGEPGVGAKSRAA